MNGYVDEIDTLLDGLDFGEFEERSRRRSKSQVRTPSRRSSFTQRPSSSPASQAQLHAAVKNLDAKIDILSNGVKALETRTNGIAADQDRVGVAFRKEVEERKKSTNALRADLQQTKMLGMLLPLMSQETVELQDEEKNTVKVLAPSSNQMATLLPLFLAMSSGEHGGDSSSKGSLGDGILPLLLVMTLNNK
ncbi:MAG: hypothetical protein ACRDTG_04855 [Pseudonocardiaceae bacterium]